MKKGEGKPTGLQVEQRPIESLIPYCRNAKAHPPRQVAALAGLIERLGFRFPCAVDEKGEIISGHGRVLAARQLGLKEVPCIVHRDLSEQDKRALRLADNRLAELAETKRDDLAMELAELYDGGFDTELIGFDDEERRKLLAPVEEAVVEEIDVSEVRDEFWLSVRGPLPKQPEVLALLRQGMEKIEGVDVQIGTSARDGIEL